MPSIEYKKNFLTNVIFRLDISSLITFEKEVLLKIQNDIFELVPVYKLISQKQSLVQFGDNQATVEDKDIHIHLFTNKEENIKLNLTEEFFTLEFTKYKNFKDFFDILDPILKSFLKNIPHVSFGRIGLRYINLINFEEGNPLEWNDFISNKLTYAIDNFFVDKINIARAVSQVIFNFEEYLLLFTYGIHNGSFPAKVNRKEFILDFDCSTKDFNDLEIKKLLEKFNHKIKEMFENCITENLRSKLEIL